jgi:hypothetical protein
LQSLGCAVDVTRMREPEWLIRNKHPDKSAAAEHSVDLGHRIQVHNISALVMRIRCLDAIVRDATQTEYQPHNMNGEADWLILVSTNNGHLLSVP